MTDSKPTGFDPARHLSLVGGKEYLEVKFRIVWIRTEHPDSIIETELVSHHDNEAVFKAYVKIPNGGSATGWGSENARGFGDYLEKAETKAVGRALGMLGFGTQFCNDFEYGAAAGKVVDSPVRPQSRQNAPQQQQRPQPVPRGMGGPPLASEKQMAAIYAISKSLGMSDDDRADLYESITSERDIGTKNAPKISSSGASEIIDALNARKAGR